MAVNRGTGSVLVALLRRLFRWSWLLLVCILLWELTFRLFPSLFIPPFSRVFSVLVETWFTPTPDTLFTSETFRSHAIPSLLRFAEGWALAVLLGGIVGVLMGVSRHARMGGALILRFGISVPATVLLPVAVVVFGITNPMNVFLITIGAMWPVVLNTMDGILGVDPGILESARSLRFSRFGTFRRVIIPAASPQIFAGLRVSLGIALILMVVSEMFVSINGLGYQIVLAQRTFAFPAMWSALVLLGLIALVLNGMFVLFERRVLSWHIERRGETLEAL